MPLGTLGHAGLWCLWIKSRISWGWEPYSATRLEVQMVQQLLCIKLETWRMDEIAKGRWQRTTFGWPLRCRESGRNWTWKGSIGKAGTRRTESWIKGQKSFKKECFREAGRKTYLGDGKAIGMEEKWGWRQREELTSRGMGRDLLTYFCRNQEMFTWSLVLFPGNLRPVYPSSLRAETRSKKSFHYWLWCSLT